MAKLEEPKSQEGGGTPDNFAGPSEILDSTRPKNICTEKKQAMPAHSKVQNTPKKMTQEVFTVVDNDARISEQREIGNLHDNKEYKTIRNAARRKTKKLIIEGEYQPMFDMDSKITKTTEDYLKVLPPGVTPRIKKVFELTITKYNGDMRAAMDEMGYSACNPPGSIQKSKSWHQLMEMYFPSVILMENAREVLDCPDPRIKLKTLELLHKLRGDFTRKIEVKVTHDKDYSQKTDEELQRIASGDEQIIDVKPVQEEGPEGIGEEGIGEEEIN